jgi:hypothetical protein
VQLVSEVGLEHGIISDIHALRGIQTQGSSILIFASCYVSTATRNNTSQTVNLRLTLQSNNVIMTF